MTAGAASRRDFIKLAGIGAGAAVLGVGAASAADAAPIGAVAPGRPVPYRVGRWLPSDQEVLNRWLAEHIRAVDADPQPLLPSVQELKELIESNPEIYMYLHLMFEQFPHSPKFAETSLNRPQVRDYEHMLALINGILTTAPAFNRTGLVGFPINAILD